ncbi:MAG: cellulase family glycosylhydrolase [Verrucomicrobiota bacterium]
MRQIEHRSVLMGLAVALLTSCSTGKPAATPGLVVKDGAFYKDGRPARAIGINYFNAFYRKLGPEGSETNLADCSHREGFETLRKYEIPFIRFCAGGFYPKEWASYQNDKEAWFKALDQLVADAEEVGLGLVPSLFWAASTVPDLVGEPLDQWGNPQSKTHAFMRQYTVEVVSRYKDSPAIWGWEFGNEYLHAADLPQPEMGRGWIAPEFGTPAERTARDKMYRKNVWVAYQAFADTVRSIDPTRPVFSGDVMPRPFAYHNWSEASWGTDSREEWSEIFRKDNAAMDTLSAHLYYYEQAEESRDAGFMEYGPEEQLPFLMEIARASGKPLFIGEFGPAPKEKTREEERRQFEFLLNLIVENEVPVSALWNFDFEHINQVHFNIVESNHRAYMLDALRDANRKMGAAGE